MINKWEFNKEGLVNATRIVKEGNVIREEMGRSPLNLRTFLVTEENKRFMEALKVSKGVDKLYTVVAGCKGATWMIPELALELTCSISPTVKCTCMNSLYKDIKWLRIT